MSDQPEQDAAPESDQPDTDLRPGTDPNPPLPNTSPTDNPEKTHFPADAFAGEPAADVQFSDEAPIDALPAE